MDIVPPKVFISYSWTSTDKVVEFAERLKSNGVAVILDRWHLKEGQDKYAFMEQSATDPTVDKVLIICDKAYTDKANLRKGGVGDETVIISQQVYGQIKQEKFIPIILEVDQDGNPYCPAYIKPRLYIDLSTNDSRYELEYEKLLRNIFNKPLYREPALGKMPEWLNKESVDMSVIRGLVKQMQNYDGNNQKFKFIARKFNDEFIKAVSMFTPSYDGDFDDKLLTQIDAIIPLRNLYLDYIESLIINETGAGTTIGEFFEQVYNGLYCVEGSRGYSEYEFEFFRFVMWELFICTTAVLLHYKNYHDLYTLLNRTYFLNENAISQKLLPCTYIEFRATHEYIEERIKPKIEASRPYTLVGDILIKRERLPILTKQALANADVVLYQLSTVYNFSGIPIRWNWFPMLYGYLDYQYGNQQLWSRMASRKHCEELFPLFGVTQLAQLVKQVEKSVYNKDMRFSGAWGAAPPIQQSIELDKIGSLP